MAPRRTENMTAGAFEALDAGEKGRQALRASSAELTTRRVLAPAEAMNAITVGSLNLDNFDYPHPIPAGYLHVWADASMCCVSSALGPGHNGATKPDILQPRRRHLLRGMPQGDHHDPTRLPTNPAALYPH